MSDTLFPELLASALSPEKDLAVNLARRFDSGTKRVDIGRDMGNGLAKLVLALVNVIHELLERQAMRRIENGSLNTVQAEALGEALMRQALTILELCDQLGMTEEDLAIDLGPLGRLDGRASVSINQGKFAHTVPSTTLGDLLERILDKGVVISGDIKIKLVEVELLTIQIRLVICSVDRAKEIGIDWWRRDSHFSGLDTSGQPDRMVAMEERLKRLETTTKPMEVAHG